MLLIYLERLLKEFSNSKNFFKEFKKFNKYYNLLEELKKIGYNSKKIYK